MAKRSPAKSLCVLRNILNGLSDFQFTAEGSGDGGRIEGAKFFARTWLVDSRTTNAIAGIPRPTLEDLCRLFTEILCLTDLQRSFEGSQDFMDGHGGMTDLHGFFFIDPAIDFFLGGDHRRVGAVSEVFTDFRQRGSGVFAC